MTEVLNDRLIRITPITVECSDSLLNEIGCRNMNLKYGSVLLSMINVGGYFENKRCSFSFVDFLRSTFPRVLNSEENGKLGIP